MYTRSVYEKNWPFYFRVYNLKICVKRVSKLQDLLQTIFQDFSRGFLANAIILSRVMMGLQHRKLPH